MVVASVEPLPNSVVSCLSHTASCAVLAKAMYSASAVDSAMDDCFCFSSSQHLHKFRINILMLTYNSQDLQPNLHLSRQQNSGTFACCRVYQYRLFLLDIASQALWLSSDAWMA